MSSKPGWIVDLASIVRQPERAARLVNAQAASLDILDVGILTPLNIKYASDFRQVIGLTPSDWPLTMVTPFLSRSYRIILHSEKEGKIVKNISAAQNLEVKDRTWNILRDEGAIVEEEEDEKSFEEKPEVVQE